MRLGRENMASHPEIREFADEILGFLDGYCIEDEAEISRVVLIAREDSSYNRILEV